MLQTIPDENGCQITMTKCGRSLTVEEDSCSGIHGASCDFSGSLRRTGESARETPGEPVTPGSRSHTPRPPEAIPMPRSTLLLLAALTGLFATGPAGAADTRTCPIEAAIFQADGGPNLDGDGYYLDMRPTTMAHDGQTFTVVRATQVWGTFHRESNGLDYRVGYQAVLLRGQSGQFVIREDHQPGSPPITTVSWTKREARKIRWGQGRPWTTPIGGGLGPVWSGPLQGYVLKVTACAGQGANPLPPRRPSEAQLRVIPLGTTPGFTSAAKAEPAPVQPVAVTPAACPVSRSVYRDRETGERFTVESYGVWTSPLYPKTADHGAYREVVEVISGRFDDGGRSAVEMVNGTPAGPGGSAINDTPKFKPQRFSAGPDIKDLPHVGPRISCRPTRGIK